MKLKIVYRILRQISDWAVDGYYSEVHVEGQENVPKDGPIIIASTHHNEIIDIAVLAAKIPYRRHLSFWAKSTMFSNPLSRSILLSSGAIPVRRNPNKGNEGNGASTNERRAGQHQLLQETSTALAAGEVVGVFPEGTSYTQPGIMQVLPGAARAAVEFVQWDKKEYEEGSERNRRNNLVIIPVAIVYTDGSRYQSRICVKFGEAIRLDAYNKELSAGDEEASQAVIKRITQEIEKRLVESTVNAPDWDTLYAAQTARMILWGDERNIALKDWVLVSQTLIKIFIDSSPSSELVKSSLLRYSSLLYCTRTRHHDLEFLVPSPKLPQQHILSRLAGLSRALLSFLLFVPPLVVYWPGYLVGAISGKYLVPEDEPEGKAQFKAVLGGIGISVGVGIALKLLWRAWGSDTQQRLGLLFIAYISLHLFSKWHNALVGGNYRRFQLLVTAWKLLMGFIYLKLYDGQPRPLSSAEAEAHGRPPQPLVNPFIRGQDGSSSLNGNSKRKSTPKPASPRLIIHLLHAKNEACTALGRCLDEQEGPQKELVACLVKHGARIPG